MSLAGSGSGSVSSDVGAIECPATSCTDTYPQGTGVTLTAVADAGSLFTGWSGAGCTGPSLCVVTMAQAQTVTATFEVEQTLTVSVVGNGTVTSDVGTIDCPNTSCTDTYGQGTGVTVTASADTGWAFDSWSGAGCSGTGTCAVTMEQPQTVMATFSVVPSTLESLTVTLTGSGSVSSDVGVIDCPATSCTDTYTQGTGVTLTAVADAGSLFTGWSGAGCTGTSLCVVTMAQAQTVTATFSVTGGPPVVAWTAAGQNSGGSWTNSSWANRSFRILLDGAAITATGSTVQLTLRGAPRRVTPCSGSRWCSGRAIR